MKNKFHKLQIGVIDSVGELNAKHLNQFQQVQTFLLLLLLLQLVSPVSSLRTQPGNQFGFGDCEGD